jgi:nucleoside-diphosphate-sugar epimerase
MRVLITGATGFVGACLTRRLLELGHEIHLFTRQTANKWRIADIAAQVTLHDVDLRNAHAVEHSVASIRPNKIFHLATYGGFSFQKDVNAIYATNFMGTVNLVHACEKVSFDCFIHTGSSSEYGIKTHPLKESDLLEPVGNYAVSKAAATLFCRSEALLKGLPIAVLRLFSPFGPWDDPQRLIPYVIASALNKIDPNLSSPAAVRDYIFIDDVIDAYLAIMESSITAGEIYNVGSGRQTDIGKVVARIVTILDNGVMPRWGAESPKRPEPEVWVADTGKMKTQFNWTATTCLEDGLQQTISWMREHPAGDTKQKNGLVLL